MGEPDAVTTGGAQEDDSVGVAVAPANSPGGSTAFGGAMPFLGARGEETEVPDPLRTEDGVVVDVLVRSAVTRRAPRRSLARRSRAPGGSRAK
jgi:hypothetical protein